MIDFHTISTSAKPLVGAVEGIIGSSEIVHLDGSGLFLVGSSFYGDEHAFEVGVDQIKSVLFGLAGMVQGLHENDVIGVAVNAHLSSQRRYRMLVVQMTPGDPSSLTVLVDGQTY